MDKKQTSAELFQVSRPHSSFQEIVDRNLMNGHHGIKRKFKIFLIE